MCKKDLGLKHFKFEIWPKLGKRNQKEFSGGFEK